jgi:2-polyprenyl-3-methyl-5-hydroxy-6-metoxy-1,4-benzoquinol methylase
LTAANALERKTVISIEFKYAEPLHVKNVAECYFYHHMDLPGLKEVGKGWDLRKTIDDYLGHFDFRGKRVLDVGTASGFLTFEMEKRGAEVVSFDYRGPTRIVTNLPQARRCPQVNPTGGLRPPFHFFLKVLK